MNAVRSGTLPNIAAGFLVFRPERRVLLHQRGPENDPDPNLWAAIGGHAEPADGDNLRQTWCRELQEELAIEAEPNCLQEIARYSIKGQREVAVFVLEVDSIDMSFTITEGLAVAWFTIPEALSLTDLAAVTRLDLPRITAWLDTSGTRVDTIEESTNDH